MANTCSLITGVCGQDGAYLAKALVERGHEVYGIARRNASVHGLERLGIADRINVIRADICDPHHMQEIVCDYAPDHIYNLAAQSHVGLSFSNAVQTCAVNYTGYLNILLAARKYSPRARIYQAGTSEMFGYSAGETIVDEQSPFMPMSPYAISKVAAYWAGVNARLEADQFVSNGILFNHESPLRGEDFVTRKITKYVARYHKGYREPLIMGNIDSIRDWGHARDYVEAMIAMLEHSSPDDFVIATNTALSVRTFIKMAFEAIGETIVFEGEGINEVGFVSGKPVVMISRKYYRPNDLKFLRGNPAKAKSILGWHPKTSINQLVEEMVEEDIQCV